MEFQFKPYDGNEPYVFISYCREDTPLCRELVSRLGKKNVRTWYDNAIHVGDEWPTIIATKLKASHVCILLITEGFVSSVNCNKELTFAVKNHVSVVPIRIEGTNITDGMDLMIGSVQYVKLRKDAAGSFDLSVLDKVFEFQLIKDCISTEPVIPEPEPPKPEPVKPEPPKPEPVKPEPPKPEPVKPEPPKPEPVKPEPPKPEPVKPEPVKPEPPKPELPKPEPVKPEPPKGRLNVVLIDEDTNRACSASCGPLSVMTAGDKLSPLIGDEDGKGLSLTGDGGKTWLENRGADLYTNAGMLRAGEKTELIGGALRLELGTHTITVLTGETAKSVQKAGKIAVLYCPATDEKRFITGTEFRLGSKYVWRKGAMDDRYVSEENAVITADGGSFTIKDVGSANGTLHNGRFLEPGECRTLSDKDCIQVGGTFLRFGIVRIKELEANKQ